LFPHGEERSDCRWCLPPYAGYVSTTSQIEVVYDGDCGLCRASIEWLERRDRHRQLHCYPSSECTWVDRDDQPFATSVVVRRGNDTTTCSTAVATALSALPGRWGRLGRLALLGNRAPFVRAVNDSLYRTIAANRITISRQLVRLNLLDASCALPSAATPPVVSRRVPLLRQTWSDIVWCHWAVDPAVVANLLPSGLTPDLYEGQAWVGLIPFAMRDLRLAGPFGALTRIASTHNFGEVNVRTYVKGPDGKTGVWFCTLDADRWLAVKTANIAFGLPYRHAATFFQGTNESRRWRSQRQGDGARAVLDVSLVDEPSRPASPGLEQFLVERYALYTLSRGHLYRGELQHQPWRVRTATVDQVVTETVAAAGVSVGGAPHVLAGEPVEVTIFPLRRV